jgi:hypothetical protein
MRAINNELGGIEVTAGSIQAISAPVLTAEVRP